MSAARDERTALIAGAAGGLGSAIGAHFLKEGWRVLGWDLRPVTDERIAGTVLDLVDETALAAAAAGLPPLSALVNCAGAASRAPVEELSSADFEHILRINVVAAFALSRAALPALRSAGGTLIHIASIGGHAGFRSRLAYDTSKSALLAMSRHLAIEWAPLGVRVLTVSPGFVSTGMAAQGIAEGLTRLSDIIGHTPTGRLVEPSEVAGVVVRLAGPEFSAVTGSDVLVDGGFAALSGF